MKWSFPIGVVQHCNNGDYLCERTVSCFSVSVLEALSQRGQIDSKLVFVGPFVIISRIIMIYTTKHRKKNGVQRWNDIVRKKVVMTHRVTLTFHKLSAVPDKPHDRCDRMI